MLSFISWSEYLTFITVSLILYYAFIFFRYRHSLLSLNREQSLFKIFRSDHPNTDAIQKENQDMMPQVHDLVQSLKDFLHDVAERSFVKEEVIMGLQIILREHKSLIGTPIQQSINDLIAELCKNNCSIQLSNDDLNIVWLG